MYITCKFYLKKEFSKDNWYWCSLSVLIAVVFVFKLFYLFSERHYRVAIQLANPKGAESWVQVFLSL